MDSKEASRKLVADLQAIRAPLSDERTAKQEQLAAKKAELSALRDEVISLHGKIRPIDELLSSANGIKYLKGKVAEKAAADIRKEMEAFI